MHLLCLALILLAVLPADTLAQHAESSPLIPLRLNWILSSAITFDFANGRWDFGFRCSAAPLDSDATHTVIDLLADERDLLLERDVVVSGPGFELEVDLWNEEHGIGFELIDVNAQLQFLRHPAPVSPEFQTEILGDLIPAVVQLAERITSVPEGENGPPVDQTLPFWTPNQRVTVTEANTDLTAVEIDAIEQAMVSAQGPRIALINLREERWGVESNLIRAHGPTAPELGYIEPENPIERIQSRSNRIRRLQEAVQGHLNWLQAQGAL
jgi:hypothetical protein